MSVNYSASTQTTSKRLRIAYNDVCHILHYIPMNVNIRPHQVNPFLQVV